MEKKEIEFVDGLLVKKPHDKAPSFVKAQISIKVEDLGKWLREKFKAGEVWVNLDVKEAKSGTWYASVNTYKAKDKDEKPAPEPRRQQLDDTDDDQPPF